MDAFWGCRENPESCGYCLRPFKFIRTGIAWDLLKLGSWLGQFAIKNPLRVLLRATESERQKTGWVGLREKGGGLLC